MPREDTIIQVSSILGCLGTSLKGKHTVLIVTAPYPPPKILFESFFFILFLYIQRPHFSLIGWWLFFHCTLKHGPFYVLLTTSLATMNTFM